MQKGFLDSGQPNSKGPDAEAADPATPTHATHQQLQECLELLRGPGDERKLVGLLMVTRALPAGDHATVQLVYNAVGPSFLARLLLPLRQKPPSSPQQPLLDEETAQKQIGMAALGLAVLSSAAQVAEIASSHEFMQLTPLFLNVARAGGVSPLIIPSESAESTQIVTFKVDPQLDSAAVRDALECIAAVATSCEEGRRIAQESGALQAAADVLRRNILTTTASKKTGGKLSFFSSYGSELLWAVRVTAAILSGPDRAALLEENSSAIESLVPGLAYTLALPALLEKENEKREAAVLHLESLHALLLLLPLPPTPQASAAQEFLRQGALQSLWARHIRLGIGMILRGKSAAVQRHSALQLTAAMVAMLGPRWLFYPLGQPLHPTTGTNTSSTIGTGSTSTSSTGSSTEGGTFYQVLVEVVKVESNVLLHDVLSPQSHVPSSTEPGTSAQDWEMPQEASESAGERALMMLPCCFFLLEAAIEALAEDNEEDESGGGLLSDAIAQRALSSLMECVDVLLQVLEEEEEEENEKGEAEEIEEVGMQEKENDDDKNGNLKISSDLVEGLRSLKLGAVRVLGRFFAEVPDAFEDRVRKLLSRLLSISSSSISSFPASPSAGAFPSSPRGAVQSLPQSPKRAIEVDSMLDSFGDFIHKVQSPRKSDTPSKNQNQQQPFADSASKVFVAAEGISFFLPMLLQVTDPSCTEMSNITSHMQWIVAIVKGGSFRHLVDFAVEIAEVEEIGKENEDVEASFMVVCRILLQIITQIEQLVEDSSFSLSSDLKKEKNSSAGDEEMDENVALEFAVADASWPLIPVLTEILSKYLGLKSPSIPTENIPGEGKGEEERVKNVACLAALLAAVMEAVADEADHPDEAHQPQQTLFNRNKSMATTSMESIAGLGPVGGEDVQQACEIVLQSMHFMHTVLKKQGSCSHDSSSGSEKQQLENDYSCLVHTSQCLMKSCSVFKETAEKSSAPEELFKGLSL